MENIIEIKNVEMHFNMSKEKIDNLKEYFIKLAKRQLMYEDFTALDKVSVNIKPGEVFGIVGHNGSGKSTLLKTISGILKPTVGTVKVHGSIAPLIELGAGFDLDLTARENIFLNGSVLGFSNQMIAEKFDEIVEFSELRDFLDVPMKNYSSGMVARIGFAVATMVKPDILIVDEILSVGDFLFQQKCEQRINALMQGGTTVLIVSHALEQIRRLCTRVMWLDKGKIKMIGDTKTVCDAYESGA
ncbi:MAG: ABC transporter ATP-binding protein [Acutalibacteraceae bacterium]